MKKSLLIAALLATALAFSRSQQRPNNDGLSNESDENKEGFSFIGGAFVHPAPVQKM